jgi:Protein of unknown function (DUF3300)
MTTRSMKQRLSSVLIYSSLGIAWAVTAPAQQTQDATATATSNNKQSPTPTAAPQTAAQLDALVAPVALYPDALVAQVLAAAAFPEQIAFADDWVAQNSALKGQNLANEVEQQSWDPSVKALTQFPSVLHNLAKNLAWTSSLGDAFTNQQADVMTAIQTMRAKANAAGSLKSSSQITVVQQSPSTIVIKPANPEVVYVPEYNPTVIYGSPIIVPAYIPPPVPVISTGVFFGTGVGVRAAFGGGWGWGGGFGWGWGSWGVNWGGGWGGGGNVVFNNNTYINNRTVYNNNSYHSNTANSYFNGSNGYRHPTPGTNPANSANGGYRSNPGQPGASGTTQRNTASGSGHSFGSNTRQSAFSRGAWQQPRSFMSGNGDRDRAASSRGWNSMRASGMRSGGFGGSRMGGGHFGGGRR